MDTGDLPVTIPAWGLFAIIVIKLVLDWRSKQDAKDARKAGAELGQPPTRDEIAAVIRDQGERSEILDRLRDQSATQERLAVALEHVANAQERIAATQDRQTLLVERQSARQRAMAEAVARITIDVASLRTDTDRIKAIVRPPGATP